MPWLTWTKLFRRRTTVLRRWQVCSLDPDGAWRLHAVCGEAEARAAALRLRAQGLTVRVVRAP